MLLYGWYAEVYQWTPEQVDRLPHWYAGRIRELHEMVIEVENEKAEAQRRSQKAGR